MEHTIANAIGDICGTRDAPVHALHGAQRRRAQCRRGRRFEASAGLRGGASSAPSDAQGRRGSKPCKYLVAPAPLGVVAPHTCAGVQYPWRDAPQPATSIEAILPEGSISPTARRGWRETLHLPHFGGAQGPL